MTFGGEMGQKWREGPGGQAGGQGGAGGSHAKSSHCSRSAPERRRSFPAPVADNSRLPSPAGGDLVPCLGSASTSTHVAYIHTNKSKS